MLKDVLGALPPEALVPVGWVLDQLRADHQDGADPLSVAELTVAQLGARLHRSPSTVRGWCERGRFEGAYKLEGRDWRIPPAAVESFLEAQRHRGEDHPELGDWRKVRRRG